MPLYFAYGANLDRALMAARCPRSKPLGLARLLRHRLAIMREGWLTVARDERNAVHGALWELALSDMPALDRFEELGKGLYTKIAQPVSTASGSKRALVYVGANAGPGRANGDYLAVVLAAARGWPLPESGIAALEALARGAEGKRDPWVAPEPGRKVTPRFETPLERDEPAR